MLSGANPFALASPTLLLTGRSIGALVAVLLILIFATFAWFVGRTRYLLVVAGLLNLIFATFAARFAERTHYLLKALIALILILAALSPTWTHRVFN